MAMFENSLTLEEQKSAMRFASNPTDFLQEDAPQSGAIMGILKQMKESFETNLAQSQKDEETAKQEYAEMKSAKEEEIDAGKELIDSKKVELGDTDKKNAMAKEDLHDTDATLAADTEFLANLKTKCDKAAAEYAERSGIRNQEIKAVSEAVNILNDDDALETFSKAKSAALVQQPKPSYDALIQLISQPGLHIKASHHHHKVRLALVGLQQKTRKEEPMSAADAAGSAEKLVVGMVNGMVGVLHDEDVGDEHKKAWCTNETTVGHAEEDAKKSLIQKTETEISEQEDQVAALISEIKALTESIQMTDKLVHEATEQRKAEHQDFVDSFATSATAMRLVDKAIKRLEKFYSPEKYQKEKKAAVDAALAKSGLSLLHKSNRPDTAMVQKLAKKYPQLGEDAGSPSSPMATEQMGFPSDWQDSGKGGYSSNGFADPGGSYGQGRGASGGAGSGRAKGNSSRGGRRQKPL